MLNDVSIANCCSGLPRIPAVYRTPRPIASTHKDFFSTLLAVKSLHRYRCQVCGTAIATREGQYAEGAHVIPLGRPHDGPDHEDNIICLCPNHHVMLDHGGIYITDDGQVLTATGKPIGKLRKTTGHTVDIASLRHHRARFGLP